MNSLNFLISSFQYKVIKVEKVYIYNNPKNMNNVLYV